MARYGPRATRYALAGILLGWAALGQLGVLVFAYDLLQSVVPWVPALPAGSVVAAIASPAGVVAGGVLFATTAALGRYRYGSLAAFTLAVARLADRALGWTLFDEPELVGRIAHDDIAWRFEYLDGGHVELVRRECPLCGLELVESYLRREVVHGPNTGFDPGDDSRETVDEAWNDVYGREKTDDHGETLALACPDCNVSVPGSADVPEGLDGARAKFERHVDRMRAGNSSRDPFGEYVQAARAYGPGSDDPTPADVWDAYVRTTDAEDVLFVGPDPAASERAGAAGAGATPTGEAAGGDGTDDDPERREVST